METTFCQSCGTQIQDISIKFCASCGTQVVWPNSQIGESTPLTISPTNLPTGRLQNEVRLLDKYNDEIDGLKDQLAEADPQTSKRIQGQLEQKMQIYWKQVQLVQSQFPDAIDGHLHEAAFYTFQALIKLFSAGLMRRMSARSSNAAIGIATGLIAKQQEKSNAMQSLGILDKALSIYDYPGARFAKAGIYQLLGQNPQALVELNYIIANFPDDDVYVLARELKDEIENPPKKGMCFVATAAYGSPLAPEVILLSRYRDEVLLPSKLGALFVALYYLISPPLAALIARIDFLRAMTRNWLLAPIIHFLRRKKTKS
ncbi:MAG: zinc ribbon domain-containing protein [Acidobacteria bacterium]|nr:zinc ribbon domain-containing protein [Acidobacteriota bacterium]